MLDVHPAHHAASTWRDFFIHIATIVLGLLIAIGLEQTVEYFHHHHQVADAREALRDERASNQRGFALLTQQFRMETKRFQTNLAVLLFLQKHPGAPPGQWPGAINWHCYLNRFNDSAWTTVERSNITDFMPQAEVRATDRLYKALAIVDASLSERLTAVRDARRYTVQDSDPSHLTPAQLAEEITLAQNVLSLHYRFGGAMRNLASFSDSSFTPAPTTEELLDIVHEPHAPNTSLTWFDTAEPKPQDNNPEK